jgi:plasmid stability protein
MTTLTLELPPDIYRQLRETATQQGKPAEELVEEWIAERIQPAQPSERERAREVLRAAGLLTELGPELKRLAADATMTLDEVSEAFSRAGGKPLSEIVIEQRGPKE